jgi:hypothetical protein
MSQLVSVLMATRYLSKYKVGFESGITVSHSLLLEDVAFLNLLFSVCKMSMYYFLYQRVAMMII